MKVREIQRWLQAERRGPAGTARVRLERLMKALPEVPLPTEFHAAVLNRCGLPVGLATAPLDPRLVWLGHALLAATLVSVALALPVLLPAGWVVISRLDLVTVLGVATEALNGLVMWFAEALTYLGELVSLGEAAARLGSAPDTILVVSAFLAVGLLILAGLHRLTIETRLEGDRS